MSEYTAGILFVAIYLQLSLNPAEFNVFVAV